MARELDFFQVYFNDNQLSKLYEFATPYFNPTIDEFFENSVILQLVPQSDADLISVCSWRLKSKRGDCYRLIDKVLTKEKIVNTDFDIAVLTPRSPEHRPLEMASHWHGKAWDIAFEEFSIFLKQEGLYPEGELSHTIYENHFIATKEIYHDYVQVLKRAMDFCRGNDKFYIDSGYIHKKRDTDEIKEYQQKSGRLDWPIMPFILERLFSIYCEGKGFKIINL